MLCDSCGASAPFVDDRHIRERIERLELATRFRPIHIQVLILDATPPARPADYFYRVTKDRSLRTVESRNYFDELTASSGVPPNDEMEEESALDAFQRRGLFLTYLVECPIQENSEVAGVIQRAAPMLLKRLKASYRPKFVALLSQPLEELIPVLRNSGWSDQLILDDGRPFVNASRLRERLSEAPVKAL